ncbi:hypothetical protein [Amycolatopsis jejuensis]|nr:hypothetical protein [Amycolatopsis jejuensis]
MSGALDAAGPRRLRIPHPLLHEYPLERAAEVHEAVARNTTAVRVWPD